MGAHATGLFEPQPAAPELANRARLPIGWRDQCGKLLIPLNVCRHENLYMTWKCDHEKHVYEKCQYDDYMNRMKQLEKAERKRREEEE
ncbi:hypothetical protein MVLG_06362 [Microbotryum lychnidis-dioicae p1A1 Lamole]|uniref:NADH dehydrogenase [ubiquinone] 1 beta subcomplex subunit 7 n=1 Tax=Microbotryum lychnidis-dioicae (strain p1A1 Lamole / MvSl-1064) TaxID=683840 RepID=U5HH20_USTV1|nr:hypothetical protein MVLG_06362 [Microbotryum lychnidis-dioicae p1A1 Lamole]|eukprot:KDE03124.1 hypothetical protein MVLG_06362 [Microbotryum lychnidis-dioicae p1A1 Lamole]